METWQLVVLVMVLVGGFVSVVEALNRIRQVLENTYSRLVQMKRIPSDNL